MSAHTPGPWVSLGSPTCTVRRAAYFGKNGVVAQATNPADALLISAAPDLLEALIEMMSAHQRGDPHPIESCSNCERAVAAIAKADVRWQKAGGEK